MKYLFTVAFLAIGCIVQAQKLPTEPADAFAFPLGTKFVIKLVPIDSVNYNYSILSFEPFREIVDMKKSNFDELFEKSGEDSTIVFYFCLGTHGETDQEKRKNMQTLLLIKNYSKEKLQYTSEIQVKEDGEYEWTSNVGMWPNIIMYEMWPYMIYYIGLKELKKDTGK